MEEDVTNEAYWVALLAYADALQQGSYEDVLATTMPFYDESDVG